MKRIKCLLVVLTVSFISCSTLIAQNKEDVSVKVVNIPSKTGKILLALDQGNYYGYYAVVDVVDSQAEIKLVNIPNGKYKIYVFHDTNNNWILDENDKGIPVEYCAIQNIEIKEDVRKISVALENVNAYGKPSK